MELIMHGGEHHGIGDGGRLMMTTVTISTLRSPEWTPDQVSRGRTGGAVASYRKTWWILLSDFFLPEHEYMEFELRSVERRGARPGGAGAPPPSWIGGTPTNMDLPSNIHYMFQNNAPLIFRSFRELLFLHKNNTIAILLKTAAVQVSSIQIMQVRVQNKGKSVWKSRYVGYVSTPPSLNFCLSSSNSVDKLKVIKKNFYKLCLLLLLQICKASIQVFSKDDELTIFTITFRSHVYSCQWYNQLPIFDVPQP